MNTTDKKMRPYRMEIQESKGKKVENMVTLEVMNNSVKETLDSWLKFGTVFLIYRICDYYLFDKYKTENFFDKDSLRQIFFILVGFAIYYLVIKPIIPVNLEHPILRNIANDTLMFGTVLVSSHVLESYTTNDVYFNKHWIKSALLILAAFASYRIIVNPFIPFNKMNPNVRPIVSDWAQFGTFLIALRIFQGKSLVDQKWIMSVLFALLGFTGYHLITKKLITVN